MPRKSNELNIYTGDVQGLATGDGRMFSCGADGSIRSWNVGKKGELIPAAARDKAHKGRVSAILYKAVSPLNLYVAQQWFAYAHALSANPWESMIAAYPSEANLHRTNWNS